MIRQVHTSPIILILALLATTIAIGCSKRLELPDLGPQLPLSAKLELAPSLTEAKFEYLDSCGHFQPVQIGAGLEEALLQTAHRMFQRVEFDRGGATQTPPTDVTIRVDLVDSDLKIQTDNLYDRPPAEMRLLAVERIHDASGTLLRQPEIQVNRRERVRIEPLQKNCDYILDPFLPNVITEFVMQFAAETRSTLAPADQASSSGAPGSAAATAAPPSSAPLEQAEGSGATGLSFIAKVLDENGDQVLEGGERLRVHLDIVNSGRQPLQNLSASISGPESLLNHFPATTLPIGRLNPGESKSLDFVATLPQAIQVREAELRVAVGDEAAGSRPPDQTLGVRMQPSGRVPDNVDDIPTVPPGFQQPHHYLVSVGLSAYRDQNVPSRKYAAVDAEMVATYFRTLGGIPASNIRLLQDVKALRPDLEEALLDWLPARVTKDSTVIMYFAGQALVTSSGALYLIPYEGTLATSSRLIPLKDLEAALSRLKAKQILFIFDGSVLKTGDEPQAKDPAPQWQTSRGSLIRLIGLSGSGKSLESDDLRHGLFTYYLLRGLRGDADRDRNGAVTLAEIIPYVNDKVPQAARTAFRQEQHPQVITAPSVRQRAADLLLTKPPTVGHP